MAKMKYWSLWFSLICIGIFIIQLIIPSFTNNFMLTPDALAKPWQFLTAVFLHGSASHLIYNLFALIFFGLILEGIIGSKKFVILFLVSGIFANIISFVFFPDTNSLGASGAIMALIGTLAVLKPMMTVWAFGIIMPMFVLALVWLAGSFLGIFGFGDQGIGHIAHLSGIIIGVIYGFYLRIRYKERKEGNNFSRKIVIPENDMRGWEDSYMEK